jgi:hypothetical protein
MARHHNINGNIVPFTAEEEAQRDAEELAYANGAFDRAMADLRQRRDSLLKATDYLALSDNTLTSAMTTYRQSLRDLPDGKDTVAKCENATFPTKP